MKPEAAAPPKFDFAQILLILAAFLAPLMGGQVMTDAGTTIGGPMLSDLFSGPNNPILSHALLSLFVLIAFAGLLMTRRVIQVPNNLLGSTVILFSGIAALSVLISAYKTISLSYALEWAVYGLGLFAVVGSIGRRNGPIALISAFVAGCSALAVLGLREYGETKAIDPTWRIFSLWNNPNALAIMLAIGFILSLGLVLTTESRGALLSGLASGVIALAILLTQSKGVVLFLPIGVIGIAIATWGIKGKRETTSDNTEVDGKYGALRLVGLFVVIALLAFLMQRAAAPSSATASGGSFSHLTNAGATQDQSAGFRQLLWKTAIQLVLHNPAGYGLGAFRFVSAKPGIVTQTVFGHNTYLQLASEGSPLLLVFLLAVIVLWFWLVFRGIGSLPRRSRILLGAVVSAVTVVLVHSLVDSDLYYFGAGLSTFMLMGVALLLSADSVAPEFIFPFIRRGGTTVAIVVMLGLFYFGNVELMRGEVRGALKARDGATATSALDTLHGIAPFDGEAWYLTAQLAQASQSGLAQAVEAAQKSVEYAPNTRHLRLLARLQASNNQVPEALVTLRKAEDLDPNNLVTLSQIAELRKGLGDKTRYREALEQIVAVEDTAYFKVRSIPELVATETYEARLQLADLSSDPKEKREQLSKVVAGFRDYLKSTVPSVIKMSKQTPPQDFSGEDMTKAQQKMTEAADAAQRLAALDRAANDEAGAKQAEADASAFAAAFASSPK